MMQRGMVPQPRRPVAGNLPAQATPKTIQDLIAANATTLAQILPKSLTPERFARIALTSIDRNPRLRECTPQSLYSCILQAATVGLEVDNALGHAYLVPFRDVKQGIVVCTLILGYKGLVTLMHRAGKVSTVEAHVVRAGDEFSYELGLAHRLVHRPLDDNEGEITHAYAIVRFKDGGTQFDVRTRKQIEAIRGRSRAAHTGPWVTDYEPMAAKCPLRRLTKFVPMSAEEARTVAADEMADAGLAQTFDVPEELAPPANGETEGETQHTGGAPAPATSSPLTPNDDKKAGPSSEPGALPIPHMASYGDVMKWVRTRWPAKQTSEVWEAVGVTSSSDCTLTPDELAAQLVTAWGKGEKVLNG